MRGFRAHTQSQRVDCPGALCALENRRGCGPARGGQSAAARHANGYWARSGAVAPIGELDLMREAANASQLRRNFAGSKVLQIPEMIWPLCASNVLVMERMEGIPISQTETLHRAGIDLPRLARNGIEIFFTQVFRDGFFHADMHPGNILVSLNPAHSGAYIALDFGIVGALSDFDKNYLAQNFLA